MRFALLGIDAEVLPLVRAIAASDGHQLVWFDPQLANNEGDNPLSSLRKDGTVLLADAVYQLAPLAQRGGDWLPLLGSSVADAVIVAGRSDDAARFEQLRRLVQERVSVVVSHPITFSVLEAYELEMLQSEARAPLVPLLPMRWMHETRWLAQLVQAGRESSTDRAPLGPIDQIIWQRQLTDRSRTGVLGQLARDVDTLRVLCGEINEVAALGSTASAIADPEDVSSLVVQMTGPGGVLIRWSVAPALHTAGGVLSLVGRRGRADWNMPRADNVASWTLAIRTSDGATVPPPPAPPTSTTLSPFYSSTTPPEIFLADQVAKRIEETLLGQSSPTGPTWPDATRSLELVEAVEKSLKKKRTISLRFEGRGETAAFKGTMASVGCGLLIASMGLTVCAVIALGIASRTGAQGVVNVLKWWPAGLLAMLSIFLVLQLLRFIIPSDGPGNKNSSEKFSGETAREGRNAFFNERGDDGPPSPA
ncbi:MAG: hypothetical protein K8T25_22360 [Planctomycetia bacterium]|nr:hypothetical protein [Planctomycetia bacterium]